MDTHTMATLREIAGLRERLGEESSAAPEMLQKAVEGTLVREASSTSAIEGEHIPYEDLQKAVAETPSRGGDPRAEGVVTMLRKCRAADRLDRGTLFDMHESLFGHLRGIAAPSPTHQHIGAYRRTHVHIRSGRGIVYEAPGPEDVERLMANFLDWVERPFVLPVSATPETPAGQSVLLPVKAAISHIWFERIHPFSDGNGRIGRAISERILRGSGKGAGYLATVIDIRREGYYEELGKYGKESQGNDITSWIGWFVEVCRHSMEWEWERMLFEQDRKTFFDGPANQLTASAKQAIGIILDDWPGGRFYTGIDENEWASLLGATPSKDESLAALLGLGVFSPGRESGSHTLLGHFRKASDRLFEVGVHWIPSDCDKEPTKTTG